MAILKKHDIAERLLATSSRAQTIKSMAAAEDIVSDLYKIIGEELLNGHDISLVGVGKIRLKQYKGRRCRNVRTQVQMYIPPTLNVKFDAEPGFKKRLNVVMDTGYKK